MTRIVINDEMWVYGCDVETKIKFTQWVEKNSPRPKKEQRVK